MGLFLYGNPSYGEKSWSRLDDIQNKEDEAAERKQKVLGPNTPTKTGSESYTNLTHKLLKDAYQINSSRIFRRMTVHCKKKKI